ncbi:ATP-binding protein [Nannocystis sp. SCPEA4]|uniref:sensor histidine kinase n=1 Tax=Nannocystis sp. SCPEA4 TaxID=2996787 RepID=UPI00226E1C2F|nr:ATP-binding protein [Nannocystis sp. SCPEA4]
MTAAVARARVRRVTVAALAPIVALAVQLLLRPVVSPTAWPLCFYPAVSFASWVGGVSVGLWATAWSVVLAWWFFVAPAHSFAEVERSGVVACMIFGGVGVTLSVLHGRARSDGSAAQRERARLEQALHEHRAELDRAQAIAHVGSWRLDFTSDEVEWSAECYRIFGVATGTPMPVEAFFEIVHPDDRERVERAWQAALAGAVYDIEHRIVMEGQVKWVRERAEIDLDAEGRPLRCIGTTQDITLRKHATEALRRAHAGERRLRAELEELTQATTAVSEAVAELPHSDVTTVMRVIARQAQVLTQARYVAVGLSRESDAALDPWVAIGVPEEVERQIGRQPRAVGLLGAVARDGRTIRAADLQRHAEFRGFPPGHPDMHSFLGVPIRFHGRPVGNIFMTEKIGAAEFSPQDQRLIEVLAARAGAALEIATLYTGESFQRAWLQTVIDQLPEGVVVLDRTGVVELMNRAAAGLARRPGTKYSAEDRLYDLRDTADRVVPFSEMPTGRALRGEHIVGAEYVMVAGERRVPVLVSATPIVVDGSIAGVAVVFQDIAPLKELERLREEWTSIVAHDLRQPVAIIALTAQGLLRAGGFAEATERERRGLQRIHTASKRLSRMIDDLLDASRIESRRLTLMPRMVDLVALTASVVEQTRDSTPEAVIRLVAEGPQMAWVDPDRIQQVLDNLLSNAVKYGEPGREIGVEVSDRDTEVEIRVTNHGAGISAEQQKQLFNRFVRARQERSVSGLGLGLYISHGIVDAHHGHLWVESTPGATTCFHCVLPRSPQASQAA